MVVWEVASKVHLIVVIVVSVSTYTYGKVILLFSVAMHRLSSVVSYSWGTEQKLDR